jgi:hypothetical protein
MNTTRDPWARAVTGIAQSAFLLNPMRLGVRHPHARASDSRELGTGRCGARKKL